MRTYRKENLCPGHSYPASFRRAATCCGVAALGYPVVLELLRSTADFVLGAQVQGAAFPALAGASPLEWQLLNLALTLLALLPSALWLMVACRPALGRWERCGLSAWQAVRLFLPAFLVLSALSNMAARLLPDSAVEAEALPTAGAARFVAFLALCVVPALGEELLFRGLMQGCLRPWGSATAIVGQGVLFGLLHGAPARSVPALVCGLALGCVAEATGGLGPGMALHLVHNALAFWSMCAEQSLDPALVAAVTLLACAGTLVWLGWALATFCRRHLARKLCPGTPGLQPFAALQCPGYIAAMAVLMASHLA